MTSVRRAKKYENIWTKTIALILRFVLGTGFIIAGFHMYMMYELGVYQNEKFYYSSREFHYECINLNYQIASVYLNSPEKLHNFNENCNYEFRILTKQNDGTFKEYLSSERNISNHSYEHVTFIDYLDGYSGVVDIQSHYQTPFEQTSPDIENTDGNFIVELKVYNPADVYEDDFSEKYQKYKSYYEWKYKLPVIMAMLVLLGILDAVFLFSSAGHDYDQEGIVLNIFDRMPYDLFTFFMAMIAIGMFFTREAWVPDSEDILEWAGLIGVIALVCMDVLGWLLSTVKRIKAGTLLKNTVTYHVLHFIYYLFVNLRLVWKVILIMAIYGLFIIFCIAERSEFSIALAFGGSVLLALPVLLWFIHADIIRENTEDIVSGDLSKKINTEHMHGALKKHAENINSIQDGIQLAVAREMKSEHLKTELITNVSHDIKTPLTSIINYVDLLQKEHTAEEEQQYLEVLDRQSSRLKKLIEDLIEASKASTGNINADITAINVSEIISQSISEYRDKFEENSLEVVITEDREDLQVMADGNLLWRVLNNLYNNICKYSQPNTRVYVRVREEDDNALIEIKNISREMLNISADELMERFVRGDSSRHTEGSGLGLNIARSLMDVMKGSLNISIDGDLFKSEIRIPKA